MSWTTAGVVALYLVRAVLLNENIVPPETCLPTSSLTIKGLNVFAVDLYSGIKKQLYQGTKLKVDLGSSQTIIGDYAKLGWGIVCKEPECTQGLTPLNGTYSEVQYEYLPSQTFLSFVSTADLNVTQESSKMSFNLMQNDFHNWPFKEWGVLGLSPSSDFIKYVTSTFGDFSFTFAYYSGGGGLNDTSYNLSIYLNHEETQIISAHKVAAPNDWVLVGSLQQNHAEPGIVCLNHGEGFVMAFAGAEKFCRDQLAKICQKSPLKCTKDSANINLAENLRIDIQNVVYTLYPAEYLHFTNDGPYCALAELSNAGNASQCAIALGLGFMRAHTPMYQIKNGVPYIGFLRFFDIKDDFSMLWLACGIFALLFISILTAIVYVNRKRRSIDDDNVYFEAS